MKKVKLFGHYAMPRFGCYPKTPWSISLILFALLLAEVPVSAAEYPSIFSLGWCAVNENNAIPKDTTPPETELVPHQNLILTGIAHDVTTNEVVMGIQVELYKFLDEENTELSYSGNFLNGEFKVPISAMHHHLLVLSRQGYETRKILVKQGQIDFDDEELLMRRSDATEAVASTAFPLRNPVEKSPNAAEAEEVETETVPAVVPHTEEDTVPLLSRIERPTSTPNSEPTEIGQPLQPSIKELPEEKASLPLPAEESEEVATTETVDDLVIVEEVPEEEVILEDDPIEAEEEIVIEEEEQLIESVPQAVETTETPVNQPDSSDHSIYSLTNNTSLWQGPVHTSTVLSHLEAGDKVEVVKKTGKWWWKVRVGDQTGFVRAELLEQ